MQHEEKKITMIVNELLTLFLLNGASDVEVKVKKSKESTEINFVDKECNFSEDFVDKLRYNLNTQRQYEVEGYYWQLVGEYDNGEEIHLVGAMIDQAEVELIDKDLYIHMTRKRH
jgi:hypothetical protein